MFCALLQLLCFIFDSESRPTIFLQKASKISGLSCLAELQVCFIALDNKMLPYVAETIPLTSCWRIANIWSVTGASFWAMVGLADAMEVNWRSLERQQLKQHTENKKFLCELKTSMEETREEALQAIRKAIQKAGRSVEGERTYVLHRDMVCCRMIAYLLL